MPLLDLDGEEQLVSVRGGRTHDGALSERRDADHFEFSRNTPTQELISLRP